MKKVHFDWKRLIMLIPFIILSFASFSYAQWTVITLPDVSTSVGSVSLVDSNDGWAVGGTFDLSGTLERRGRLFHFLNGDWTDAQLDYTSSCWGLGYVQFISHDEGWAVGSDCQNNQFRSLLFHYANGGWAIVNLQDLFPTFQIYKFYFLSSSQGWATGIDSLSNKVVFLRYTNGSWSQIKGPNLDHKWNISEIFFTSPDEGWAVGTNQLSVSNKMQGFILHYLNGSWKKARLPFISSGWGLNGLYFTSANEGWAVGFKSGKKNTGKGFLFHYLNGTWKSIEPPDWSSSWSLTKVQFTSTNEGWAVGSGSRRVDIPFEGVSLHYVNGSWTAVDIPNLDSFLVWAPSDVFFTSPNEGWIVGGAATALVFNEYVYHALFIKYSSP